jgi:hypothetical protein
MDIQQRHDIIFNIRPDGVVEMPNWGAELMFAYLLYSPHSWPEIARRLKTLRPFGEHLDQYNLIYAFYVALNTRNPILFGLLDHDATLNRYQAPILIESLYDEQSNPWLFWDRPAGMDIRRIVSQLMNVRRRATELSTSSGRRWRRDLRVRWRQFCGLVDTYGSCACSVSSPRSLETFQTLTL